MATYTLETPRGKRLTIESDSPENATRLADQWDLEDHAVSEAKRQGVDPGMILRQMQQESGGRVDAVSPKGARGPMQLMPKTAQGLGVDPDDPYQNITGGVTYMRQQLDRYGGDQRKALAAYNAGPEAVDKYGGVPPFKETQAYVDAIAGGGTQPKPKPPPMMPAPAPQKAASAPPRPVGDDVAVGLGRGAVRGGAGLGDSVLQMGPLGVVNSALQTAGQLAAVLRGQGGPRPTVRPSAPLTALASRTMPQAQTDAGRFAEKVGTMLPNALIPASIPQRAANVVLPAVGQEGGERLVKALGGGETAQAIGGMVGAGLGGLGASLRLGPKGVKLPTADVGALDQAQKTAWQKVNASTYRFPASDAQGAASDVAQIVREADPDLYPKSAQWAAKIQRMADRDELTLGKLNTLKSQVKEQLVTPGNPEASVGGAISDRIEKLINTAQDPALAAAREAYKRFKKVQEVTNRTESADLRAASTYAGGNKANATRQNLRPLIDPKSNQRINNLTPDERAALNKVVRGTAGANLLRVTGKALDPRGLLGAAVQATLGLPTHGLSAPSALLGMAASEASNASTKNSVQQLLDLIAAGGVAPKPTAPIVLSPSPYAGLAGVTGGLLATPAIASTPQRKKSR